MKKNVSQIINDLPKNYFIGEFTEKQAVDYLGSLISKNYPMFNLQQYDEDFRQEVLLAFLERGKHLLEIYNPSYGDFFTFLYCYISSISTTIKRRRREKTIKEKICYEEEIRQSEEKNYIYKNIDYGYLEEPKVPYAPSSVPKEELQKALQELAHGKKDKRLIVLALKSSFYITDRQLDKVSRIYNVNKDCLYNLVENCNRTLDQRYKRRLQFQERRNYAYYHHKRCSKIMEHLLKEDDTPENQIKLKELSYKEQKHKRSWLSINKAFEKGYLNLRPTNKTVADIIGICERQVSYYLNQIKNEQKEKDKKNKI